MRAKMFRTLLVAGVVASCSKTPEVVLRVQGTVTSIGYARPVRGAEVAIDWPAHLGGGTTSVKTDADGHYAIGRTVRTAALDCKGVVITVRADGFASAYNQSSGECEQDMLTEDFKLFPIPN